MIIVRGPFLDSKIEITHLRKVEAMVCENWSILQSKDYLGFSLYEML